MVVKLFILREKLKLPLDRREDAHVFLCSWVDTILLKVILVIFDFFFFFDMVFGSHLRLMV